MEYGSAPLKAIQIDEPLIYEAHDVLDYAAALLEVVGIFLDFSENHIKETCLLGFMTGSGDLLWLARRLLTVQLESKVRLARGLRHKGAGRYDPVVELRAILDSWKAFGMHRLVVVDEMVGGAQLGTALREVTAWAADEAVSPPLELLLVAVAEPGATSIDDRFAKLVLNTKKNKAARRCRHVQLQHRCVETPLLAKDTQGRPIKDFWKGDDDEYGPWPEWRRRFRVQCSEAVRLRLLSNPDQQIEQTVPAGVRVSPTLFEIYPTGAAGPLFGTIIWDLAGFKPSLGRTRLVESAGCSGCAGRARLVREKGAMIRERVRLRSIKIVTRPGDIPNDDGV